MIKPKGKGFLIMQKCKRKMGHKTHNKNKIPYLS